MMDWIDRRAASLGFPSQRMPSGAGHDAQEIAHIAPMAMIFVPSVGGISHSPREFTKRRGRRQRRRRPAQRRRAGGPRVMTSWTGHARGRRRRCDVAVWSWLASCALPPLRRKTDSARPQLQPIAGAARRNVDLRARRRPALRRDGHRRAPLARDAEHRRARQARRHLPNAFVTTALCSPSRASILTGQYAHRHRVVDNNSPIPAGTTFFPQYLQAAGYETAFIGKWHMGGESDAPQPGFDRWVSFRGQGTYLPTSATGSTSTARPCRSAATSPTSSPITRSTG